METALATGLDALAAGPRLFDLTGRVHILILGKDRVAFLQGLITNDVKALRPGDGCYAAFLTPKGKMLADLVVLCTADALILDSDPALADTLESLLRKYLFYHDVSIESCSRDSGLLHVTGGRPADVLRRMGLTTLPRDPHSHVEALLAPRSGNFTFEEREGAPPSRAADAPGEASRKPQAGEFAFEEKIAPGGNRPADSRIEPVQDAREAEESPVPVRIVAEARAGIEGYDLRGSRQARPALVAALEAAGARPATPEVLETARIESGIPRWGAELDSSVLPDEAGLFALGGVSYTKGCYIGQETVARIRTYGHVNRHLVRLVLDGTEVPAAGAGVFSAEQKTGAVTSAAFSSRRDRPVALAYVKREDANEGKPLQVALAAARAAAVVSRLAAEPAPQFGRGPGRPSR